MKLITRATKPLVKLRSVSNLKVNCPCCFNKYEIEPLGRKINTEYITICCGEIIKPQATVLVIHSVG